MEALCIAPVPYLTTYFRATSAIFSLELFQHGAEYPTAEQKSWDQLVMRGLSICDKSGPLISAGRFRAADASAVGTL